MVWGPYIWPCCARKESLSKTKPNQAEQHLTKHPNVKWFSDEGELGGLMEKKKGAKAVCDSR